ncbi:alpha/beta fold hydrolase [Erythrobacter sp.]|uniref:alpha/beta fold hydrolase n=1 Tax=Erythrobacter sp. TaxID=1042 RepID=UPI0025FCF0EF|nr:alpha/beta fold hydrolase [Erythrobacter sp.]
MLTAIATSIGLLLSACVSTPPEPAAPVLSAVVEGTGNPTVVFIHGNGNATSGDWQSIAPQVAEMGVRTMVYDRAGHGESALFPTPYRLKNEAAALDATLVSHGIKGPIVLVAHSYGEAVAQLVAASRPDVVGAVFVDALIPGTLTADVAQGQIEEFAPRFDKLRAQAPELAAAVIPIIEAFPETASTLGKLSCARDLPTIVVSAEQGNWSRPQDIAHSKAAVSRFVQGSQWRSEMIATKEWASGHERSARCGFGRDQMGYQRIATIARQKRQLAASCRKSYKLAVHV